MTKHPFEYQKPSDIQVTAMEGVGHSCKRLYDLLMTLPPSRERSLAITKVEEALMWGNRAIVFTEEGE